MFGYFLRRLDNRFQLERSAGLIGEPDSKEEAISRLERLFNQADNLDLSASPDTATPSETTSTSSSSLSETDPGEVSQTHGLLASSLESMRRNSAFRLKSLESTVSSLWLLHN